MNRAGFDHWDMRSWVRSKPRRFADVEDGKFFFSSEINPLFTQPEVINAPEPTRQRLLVQALYVHLEFTIQLETTLINKVLATVRSSTDYSWISDRNRRDLLRIYADEGGHAEMYQSLMLSVKDMTSVEPIAYAPLFIRAIDNLASSSDVPSSLFELAAAVVSETAITGTMSHVPQDQSVQTVVRQVIADHASDEGLHHSFFRQLLAEMWPRIPTETRRSIGVIIPEIISAFLEPEESILVGILEGTGHNFGDINDCAHRALGAPRTRQQIRQWSRPCIKAFQDAGALGDPAVLNRFRQFHDF
ncbi:MAG: diiron oxygenase [Pseudonocardiaceae bacterium]